ncbi:MAG: antibiotic biosynthesis monooxygenase family protein [Candidatus Electrothrix aestuarii]|uniref:Antibiotic biosynthesis monooxygenase family protein n=1 Tax=Candidatus Electrothrix aestuarii TaxID=3062594 RepID=A0AAU8LSM1_9BACT|nr:antibiotic biosynthesis monooxygenase family protein [Candidatus Electrothrix aestuarii]
MQKEITAVVFSFIKPEFVKNAIQIYQEAIDNYYKLEGCRGIQLFRKVNQSNEFMVISKWRSVEAREKYMNSEFHKNSIEKLKPYRERDPIMNNYEEYIELNDK